MPTLNKYKNEPGYFIRAWAPETGNITYQIRREGNPIVEDYGLHDGDEISWDIIRTLKTLGLVSTNESGIIPPDDDFEPDQEEVEVTSLTEQEAYELIDALQSHQEISSDKLVNICSILGVEPPVTKLDKLENSLEKDIQKLIAQEQLPVEHTLGDTSPENVLLVVSINDIREETQNGELGVNMIIMDGADTNGLVYHWAFVCQEHGIETWEIHYNDTVSWSEKGEVLRQEGQLISALAISLQEFEIEPGNPSKSPQPSFIDIEEIGV